MEEEERVTLFKRFKWWLEDVSYYPKHFREGIQNLWKWFPVIWKDRDWDSMFIYEILKFKITKQAKYIGSRDIHVSAKRDAEIMMLTTNLIQKCKDEHYGNEYSNYHKSNYNWLDIEGRPNYKKMDIELVTDNFDEYFKKYPRQYKRVMNGEINRYRSVDGQKDKKTIAMEISYENQNRCRILLFKVMSEHIGRWWN